MDRKLIKIFDTTLRDGEQAPGATLYSEEKIRIASQLVKLGVDVIEPGFPASSPGDFTAVQHISRMVQGVEISAFARAIKEDIDSALKATEDAEKRRLFLFLSSSQIHLDFQLRKSREQVIDMARKMVAYGKQFEDRIEFAPMDATRTGEDFLFELIEAVIKEGATMIKIADTVGYSLPEEYGRIFTRLRSEVRGGDQVQYGAHCHNDLGMAVANSLAAIQAGVSQVDVTINGVGERAGNCSLEELVMALETRKDTLGFDTNIQTFEIYETSRLASRLMNFPLSYNKPIVGRNAFQHESGIHQDGVLKNRSTYEIMDPEQIGIQREMIILGKHSGRHALKHRIGQFGVDLTESQINDLFGRFKELADAQKYVSDDQLLKLVGNMVDSPIEPLSLVDVQVVTSHERNRMTSVTLCDNHSGLNKSYFSTGEGSVETIIQCIKQAVPSTIKFEDMEIHLVSNGETANGEAVVTISNEGQVYRGTGTDHDILFAVAKAFLSACNQALNSMQEQLQIS